jgi:hypothetical protein
VKPTGKILLGVCAGEVSILGAVDGASDGQIFAGIPGEWLLVSIVALLGVKTLLFLCVFQVARSG